MARTGLDANHGTGGGGLGKRRQYLSWWGGRFRSLLFDLLVAVLSIVPTIHSNTTAVIGFGVMLPTGIALLLRRRFPWVALSAATVLVAVANLPVPLFIAIYSLLRWRGPDVLAWSAIGCAAAIHVTGLTFVTQNGYDYVRDNVLFAIAHAGTAAVLGLWAHQRGKLLQTLRERAEQAERERDLLAERAVTAERRRIAREMHDVVAHRVSVVSLQAGGLTVTATDTNTAEVAETIRNTSSTALTELRSMLRVLRDDDVDTTEEDAVDAAPTLDRVRELVDDASSTGAHVRLQLPNPIPETSGTVSRAAYRVVQEALTNAAKHAPHAAVQVAVEAGETELSVTVQNQPEHDSEIAAVPGSGYGLIGMRERVTLAGGTLRTGRTEDGGYRVRAILPLVANEVVT